ncbi:hypothetical protein K466DRAFT_589967 [Polyporus arcularius HHB13444]|uniref:Uncharacterized protein n=1 Tax=Polyporus arcularius HHB13444 TaxID=1314778 RepID=A0A5C3PBE3_9APHY|nr:hypothetical protein K466DRAFT_589967 [Polyporus arcularius HHB13444]
MHRAGPATPRFPSHTSARPATRLPVPELPSEHTYNHAQLQLREVLARAVHRPL